jgi:hypothetical protein
MYLSNWKKKRVVYISCLIVYVILLQAAVGAEPGAETFPGQWSGASVQTGKVLHRHLAK